MIFCLLDTSGNFSKFIAENFTKMPLVVVLGGVLGGYVYVLNPIKNNVLGDISRTWLELIQQFFTVGVGAFWLIKCGLFLRQTSRLDAKMIDWAWDPAYFFTLVLGAVLVGGLYELRDEPISSPIKWLGMIALICICIIFIPLMLSPNGEQELLKQTKDVIFTLYSVIRNLAGG